MASVTPVQRACIQCSAQVPLADSFCRQCGSAFVPVLQPVRRHWWQAEHNDPVSHARRWLLLLAGMTFVFAVITYLRHSSPLLYNQDVVRLGCSIDVGLAVVYFALWFWAKHRPLAATSIALFIYVACTIFIAVKNPSAIASGIVVRVFVIAALVKAISSSARTPFPPRASVG